MRLMLDTSKVAFSVTKAPGAAQGLRQGRSRRSTATPAARSGLSRCSPWTPSAGR